MAAGDGVEVAALERPIVGPHFDLADVRVRPFCLHVSNCSVAFVRGAAVPCNDRAH